MASQWTKLVFAPEGAGSKSQAPNPHPTLKELLASIEIFVRFYWALYNKDEKGALDVVNRERKKRGFGYLLLPPHPRRVPQPTQAEKITLPHDPDVLHGSTSETWRSSGSRGTRALKMRRGGRVGETGADSGKAKHAADGPNSAAVAGDTGSIKATTQGNGNGE